MSSPLFPLSWGWTTMPTHQSSSSRSSASSPLRRVVAAGQRSMSASSSSVSVTTPCDDRDSEQNSERWVELVRNGCVVLRFFPFSFSKRTNWQHVCDRKARRCCAQMMCSEQWPTPAPSSAGCQSAALGAGSVKNNPSCYKSIIHLVQTFLEHVCMFSRDSLW